MNQTALKSGYKTLELIANSRIRAGLNNWKLENLSLLFGPQAQYLGSDKRWVLSLSVTYLWMLW